MSISTEERRIVTVLFADMAGSTALGEELDAEEMRRLLTRYYTIAREIVTEHGGTVEKFIGDAVMAVFGLPTAHGDDPDRAVAAALAMRDRIRSDEALGGRLAIRFGVSTGEVVASRDQSAGDFLITGDATNVAARLQQAAEPWSILVSDRTVRAAIDDFEFGDEVQVSAKGKSVPVTAREVLGPRRARARRKVSLPLVGRENDLAQLQLVARRAVGERRPSMVSVIAPAGTGKTRLVEEFLDWLPSLAPNTVVATAQCLPYGQQLTYWPMRQVLFTLTGASDEASPAQVREAIGAWLRRLGVENVERDTKLLAATIGEAGTEGADKDLLFSAWRSALEAAARRTPIVIVFEDLHWSSDSLLDLAEFVMQPRGEAPVLMVVLARPELLDRRPAWGGGRLNHLAIALEPLGDTAIADLVRHLLDTDAPDVIKLVSERSEGNPFYAGELVRSYLEQGSLERLPDTVQGTVLARLDLLPPMERRVLQLGSVFGRAFRAAGIAAIESGLAEQAGQLCENLADRDLIRPADSDRFAFRHILIQEVAYNTLPRTERARLHGAAARWVESTSEGREVAVAEILAFHYREAAVLSAALEPASEATASAKQAAGRWLLKAADVAAAAGATPEAVRHIRASFDYVEPGRLPQLHERIGDLTAGDSGLEEYRMALELYASGGAPVDDQLRALAGILLVATRWQGSVGGRMSLVEMNDLRARGRELLELSHDPRSIGRFLAADAFYPFWLSAVAVPSPEDNDRAEGSARRAADIALELDDPDLASAALDALGGSGVTQFDWSGALDAARRRIAFEERLGFYERLDAHSMVAWMSYLMGDLATADSDSAAMIARVLPGQAPYPALHLFAWRTITLMMLGRWDEAVSTFYRSLEAWNDAGRHAAGYALRGFVAALDIGRARGDARLINAASDPIMSIVSRFPADHAHARLTAHVNGEVSFTPDDPVLFLGYPSEMVERRLSFSADQRAALPAIVLPTLLSRALEQKLPLLEAQTRRAIGLANRDPSELSAAMAIWDRIGSPPNFGRARAERGLLTGDQGETAAGLSILKKLGDVNYVDRFASEI
ncbi:MAG TPA: adenylate/guanylate cyclase domain-containing protein [Candidatus Dormibacteraeota bacterium]|nr:adenylate/guanylate cyclase domain-containing protein [Candidatus Dormibacteraeota bacterium]